MATKVFRFTYPRYEPGRIRPSGTGAFFDFAIAAGRPQKPWPKSSLGRFRRGKPPVQVVYPAQAETRNDDQGGDEPAQAAGPAVKPL